MEYKIPHKKAEVTPKVTSTKISISKSTPFFIRRHHLDDTQMKDCLQYDRTVRSNKRAYSYAGEVFKCVNSREKEARFDQRWNLPKDYHNDYYEQNNNSKMSRTQLVQKDTRKDKRQQPNLQNNKDTSFSSTKNPNPIKTQREPRYKQIEDQQQQQSNRIKQHLSNQADTLRRLYKQRAQNDLKDQQNEDIRKLSSQIHELKIRNLQLQKQKWQKKFKSKKIPESGNQTSTPKDSLSNLMYNRGYLITHKGKFRNKHTHQDTDSSFSSFELL